MGVGTVFVVKKFEMELELGGGEASSVLIGHVTSAHTQPLGTFSSLATITL